ncbi:hypothetical protein FVE85_3253 [Porphyridium purpureum]|uniref:Uncharacterized protein n=1 Tax=Porphyridium purpureum TaxID=35688 RepID=A0A5J4YW29_PORPP|nr:hypothetical protein FVE85_3253 [Porphyridium purpureum]|eukprot:POR4308..scf227_4
MSMRKVLRAALRTSRALRQSQDRAASQRSAQSCVELTQQVLQQQVSAHSHMSFEFLARNVESSSPERALQEYVRMQSAMSEYRTLLREYSIDIVDADEREKLKVNAKRSGLMYPAFSDEIYQQFDEHTRRPKDL